MAAELLELLARERGTRRGELHVKEAERFQRDRYAAGYRFLLSIRAMQPILSYLRGLGVAPAASSPPTSGALEAALKRYRGYLTVERGVANESACRYINLGASLIFRPESCRTVSLWIFEA